MASHSYKSELPSDIKVNPSIVAFFESFYQISDQPGDHERYVSNFTDDATFTLASKTGKGTNELLTMREGMWAKVASRKHTVHKIFPFGNDSREFMLYGVVDFVFKAGGEGHVPWAARAVMDDSAGRWRMSFYQVYLDTGAK